MEDRLSNLMKFFHEAEKLKLTLRKYPLSNGRRESSAEHSWRLSLMTFVVAEELKLDIDLAKAMKMAIVHDIAEAYCGDFDTLKIWEGKLDKGVKEKAEHDAIIKLKSLLPEDLAEMIYSLWLEYEEEKTPEARYIKALDKIETTIGYMETDHSLWEGTPRVAYDYSDPKVKRFPELTPLLKVLKKELKKEYESSGVEWKKEYDAV